MSFRSTFSGFVNGVAQPFGEHMGKVVLGVAPTAGFTVPALYTWLTAPALCSFPLSHLELLFRHLALVDKVLFQLL
jgi:hypothetical protein